MEEKSEKELVTETNKLVDKLYKSGEIHNHLRENSTFYGEENLKNIQHKHNKTSFNLKNNTHKKNKTLSMFNFTVYSQNVNNRRLLGMSEYQSSNSLQNSTFTWTFSKSLRFTGGGLYKRPVSDCLYTIPDKKNGRYTTQGFGNRYDLRPLQGRSSPPPDTYRIKSSVEINKEKKKGVKILEKVPALPHPAAKFPGPGTYDVTMNNRLTKGSPIQLKSRTMFFYDEDLAKQKHCISPQTYLPSTKIVENLRFTKIGFGVGGRSPNELTHNVNIPGPGTYNLPSVFDKTRKNKVPLN